VIDAAANFTQTFQRDGRTIRGKVNLMAGRDPVRGREEPSRGQLMLIQDSGQMDTMYFEFTGPATMDVQNIDGTKFTATKR
jgi:hypothetical protein